MKSTNPQPRAESSSHSESAPQTDPDFSEIIDEVTDRLVRGEQVDIEHFANRLPQHTDQLRRLLTALIVLHSSGHESEEGSSAADPLAPSAGTGSIGEYAILRELGRGGMGVVYEALQLSLDRRVALKILPLASMLDERRLQRFKNEARAAAMLKHPNIVSVHATGCERNVHYYAMELIDGETLAALTANQQSSADRNRQEGNNDLPVEPNKPVEPNANTDTQPIAALTTSYETDRKSFHRSIARLGVQAADALDYAHQEGVIHRDIKPSNLIIDPHGQLHITDFGLARIQSAEDLTMSGDMIGTLRYMSPEQIDGRQVADQRTDVYSLGLTLYELLAGRPAFDAGTRGELLIQIVETEPPSLHSRDRIEADLATVIAKSISKDPADRYQTARDFHDDLQRYLQYEPVVARPTTRLQRIIRWCRRNRAAAALIGLVSLILLTFAIGGPVAAVQQAKLAEQRRVEIYEGDMAKAHRHIEDGEIKEAVALLRQYIPSADKPDERDLRHFEWRELAARCERRLVSTTIDLEWPCWSGDWLPDGKAFVSSVYFGGPAMIDVVSGNVKWRGGSLSGGEPKQTCYVHGGKVLVVYGGETMQVWDADSGGLLASPRVPRNARSVSTSTTGIVALGVSGSDVYEMPGSEPGRIAIYALNKLIEADARELVEPTAELLGPVGRIRRVAFSHDGKRLAATSHDGTVHLWNTNGFKEHQVLQVSTGPTHDICFSMDDQLIGVVGGDFQSEWHLGKAVVFEMTNGKKVFEANCGTSPRSVCFAHDNRLVAGDEAGAIRIWNLSSHSPAEVINAHADNIRCLRVSPDGRLLASMSDDNTVRLWQLISNQRLRTQYKPKLKSYNDLDFSADSSAVFTASMLGVASWQLSSGQQIATNTSELAYEANGIAAAPTGDEFASLHSPWPPDPKAGSDVRIWNTNCELQDSFHVDRATHGRGIAYAPSGEHIAVTGGTNLVLWNRERRTIDKQVAVENAYNVVFSRDGRLIATPAELLEYPSLTTRAMYPSGFGIDIHPDSKTFAVGGSHGRIEVRSTRDGSIIRRFIGHTDIVLYLDFSPDGERLASGSQNGTVILWNMETGNEIVRYRDHDFWVRGVKFSPDGQALVSSESGTINTPHVVFRRAIPNSKATRLLMAQD